MNMTIQIFVILYGYIKSLSMRFLALAARINDKIDVFYKNTTGNIFFDLFTIDETSAVFDSSDLSEDDGRNRTTSLGHACFIVQARFVKILGFV